MNKNVKQRYRATILQQMLLKGIKQMIVDADGFSCASSNCSFQNVGTMQDCSCTVTFICLFINIQIPRDDTFMIIASDYLSQEKYT